MLSVNKLRFLNIGDPHFYHSAPACRIDDYPNTCLNKLNSIFDYCDEQEIDFIIINGDFFNKVNIPFVYLNTIIEKISEFKKIYKSKYNRDYHIFTIIGNHDLPYENFNYLNRSPLYTLIQLGIIEHLDLLEIKDNSNNFIYIKGFDYSIIPTTLDDYINKNINTFTSNNNFNSSIYNTSKINRLNNTVCVLHEFFDLTLQTDNLTKRQADELGYSLYLMGHDHLYYKPFVTKKYTVLRSGSLLRNSSHKEQIERMPLFYDIEYNIYTKSFSYKEVQVKCAETGSRVFSEEAITKPVLQENKQSLSSKINNIISSISEEQNKEISIFEILNNMDIEDEVLELLKCYLRNSVG